MSRKIRKRKASPQPAGLTSNQEQLVALQNWFLPDDGIFAHLKFHGNTSWLPRDLTWLAIHWSWSECRSVTEAFTQALEYSEKILTKISITTYQGLMAALVKWHDQFIVLLCLVLQARMQEIGGKFWQIGEWVPIAFDGSRSTAPRTKSNEKALCAQNYGKGKTARYRKKKTKGLRRWKNQQHPTQPQEPQAWITMMWHMRLRLPWCWRLGPSDSSERGHVMEMLQQAQFPANSLLCGDAGFIGYPLWSTIVKQGYDFLVRVGANASLLEETVTLDWQQGGIVLCWPKDVQAHQPPLRLRLVSVKIGKTKVWVLTSVLDPEQLTIKQMIRLYKMRWGVETEFRGLKQTMHRSKLSCRNSERVMAELNFSIMAMAVAELFALKEQLSKKRGKSRRPEPPPDPAKRSLAQTLRALRACIRNLDQVPRAEQDLTSRLRAAVTDSYRRKASKRARYRPPNPDKKPLGDPKIRPLTPEELQRLKKMAV